MIPDGWLTLGTVLKPRGNRGEVLVELLTNSAARLTEVASVTCFAEPPAKPQVVRVEEAWMNLDKAIVKFAGIDSIDEAEAFRGLDLCIPLSERRRPEPGEVFLSDFVGCQVFNRDSVLLGSVTDWYEAGEHVWLELDPGKALVPYVAAFFVEKDFEKKRLVAEFPPGLLEVNRP